MHFSLLSMKDEQFSSIKSSYTIVDDWLKRKPYLPGCCKNGNFLPELLPCISAPIIGDETITLILAYNGVQNNHSFNLQ